MAAGFTPTFIYLSGGLIIWAGRFLAAYSYTAIACSRGWSQGSVAGLGVVQAGVGVLSLAAIIGCAALLAWAVLNLRRSAADRTDFAIAGSAQEARSEARAENTIFVHYLAATMALLALLAIAWETLPVLMVPVCT